MKTAAKLSWSSVPVRMLRVGMLVALVAGCAGLPGTKSADPQPESPPGHPRPAPTAGTGQAADASSGLKTLATVIDGALTLYDQIQENDEKVLAKLSPSHRELFKQRTVSGDKLVEELRRVSGKVAESTSPSVPRSDQQTIESVTREVLAMAIKEATRAALKAIQEQAGGRAFGQPMDSAAVDEHVKQLTGPGMRQALSAETVVLRGFAGMTDDDARRILRMAALQLGVRLSERLLRQAEEGFAGAEVRYAALLKQSEEATRLLADALVVLQGTGPGRRPVGDAALVVKTFTPSELRRLQSDLQAMNPSDFANDLHAQQRALKLLRAKDPGKYRELVLHRDVAVQQTRHYVRAVAGIAGFIGFSVAYVNDMGKLMNAGGKDALLSQAPALLGFAAGALPVASRVGRTLDKGLLPGLLQTDGGFVITLNGQTATVPRAGELFQQLQQAQAIPTLATGLFARGGQGWLARLRMCDAAGAGVLMDAATPPAERAKAVLAYLGEPARAQLAAGYRFERALPVPTLGASELRMHDELLNQDQRQRASHPALGELQRQISQGLIAWDNDMLMRLIFANREGGAAQASLYVGDGLVIRPRASAKAVFVFRQYEDACTPGGRRADAATVRSAGA